MPAKPKAKSIYVVTSLGGKAISERERMQFIREHISSEPMRALIQVIEEEMLLMQTRLTDPESLKDGTQPHWAGAVDGLNGALLRVAETVEGA